MTQKPERKMKCCASAFIPFFSAEDSFSFAFVEAALSPNAPPSSCTTDTLVAKIVDNLFEKSLQTSREKIAEFVQPLIETHGQNIQFASHLSIDDDLMYEGGFDYEHRLVRIYIEAQIPESDAEYEKRIAKNEKAAARRNAKKKKKEDKERALLAELKAKYPNA